MLARWIRFNAVGVLGMGVQLAVLAWLVHGLGARVLWATAIAVEAAVLHNFCWHTRWTWPDRPAATRTALLRRIAHFHLLNGGISLAGNLLLMAFLMRSSPLGPVAANVIAIAICSMANFAASERRVFRTAAVAILLAAAAWPVPARAEGVPASEALAVDLEQRTLAAWTTYVGIVDGRYGAASRDANPFFALDAFGAPRWRETAAGGSVAMVRIDRPQPRGQEIEVPAGKIHHWAGAIFVPGATVAGVLERLSALAGREADHHHDVIASKLLSRDGDAYRIFMKLRRTKVITVTYNTEHAVQYRRVGDSRATGRSEATRIAELDDAGTGREREKPPGHDSGYLWRLNAYWRYERVNGGVLIECESVSLSRAVPMLLRPFISGLVEGVAEDSLERTLTELRAYLTAR